RSRATAVGGADRGVAGGGRAARGDPSRHRRHAPVDLRRVRRTSVVHPRGGGRRCRRTRRRADRARRRGRAGLRGDGATMTRVLVVLALIAAPAVAAPARPATFALIIGVNHSVDRDADPLRYADDDAAQYFELFRSLGARTYLLTDLDDGDRKLYPQ